MASNEERWDALDAIAAAMDSRQGGLVPDVPRGARTWGEADGYWITMHKDDIRSPPIQRDVFDRAYHYSLSPRSRKVAARLRE